MKRNDKKRQRSKAWDGCLLPGDKARRLGLESLSDSELVALIIRSGTRTKTALQLASEILAIGDRQLMNLYQLSVNDMLGIEGVGEAKALQLKAVAELSKRIASSRRVTGICVENPATIADYYMESMRHEKQERFVVALFDSKGHFIADSVVTQGTVRYAVFSPREVFAFAVSHMASFLVVLHNHPSGNCDPSAEDDKATVRIAKCGKLMEISLLDHIIIGDNTYYSYRENGLLD